MPKREDYRGLLDLLRELGLPVLETGEPRHGFPLSLPLQDGGNLVLDLPEPGILASLDPNTVGAAMLDRMGCARLTWGLAQRIPHFQPERSVLMGPLAGLLEDSFDGQGGSLYLDGHRYFAGALRSARSMERLILVLDAGEEKGVRHSASRTNRAAETLRRLGKALTMHQTRQPMCVAAAHELASSLELAAVLIWARDPETDQLTLLAGVGANRQAATALRVLGAGATGCMAELVAESRRSFHVGHVSEHLLTSNVEARSCYLKPGSVSVHPLVISDRLLGVLELVGREEEPYAEEHDELFQTVAEHMSLALNSATMFENFERWASHDALTGIANHRALQEFLHTRLAEAQRTEGTVGVLMIDVDHFRAFNEEEGHDAGDEVLRHVADALKACVRPYDLAARYGGEEFCVVAPNSTKQVLLAMAERLRERVSTMPYVTRTGQERHVTVSVGCAEYPTAGDDASSLLKAADRALFQAKRRGRDRVVFYDRRIETADHSGPDMEKLWKWVSPKEKKAAKRLSEKIEPYLAMLSGALRLTFSQTQMLRAMAIVANTYLHASSEDIEKLQEIERAEEFRTLLPGLQGLEARYDGAKGSPRGTRIPLLSRVLAVLMAIEEEGGQPIADDPGRFDPEIVAIVTELYPAA